MQKILLFVGCIATCAIGAFFLWAGFASNTSATPAPIPAAPAPSLSDLEKQFAENPDNMMAILAETRSLIAGSTRSQIALRRSRLQLERATAVFYQKHISEIAVNLYKRGDKNSFREAFQRHGEWEIKADITPEYAERLKKAVLAGNINVKNYDFRAYAYILGRLSENPKTKSGSLDIDTLNILKTAEAGKPVNAEIILGNDELQKVFESLGYLPWRPVDLRSMRRIIASESLSSETRYTRAYVTAQLTFGRNALGKRIYLRNRLIHQKQIASLSCEANSTAHFYNYYAGLAKTPTVTEKQAFDWFPVDDRLPVLYRTPTGMFRKWGDPDAAFVGKVEGRQSVLTDRLTGYGIHAKGVEPVLDRELSALGYETGVETFNEMNVVLSLANNHPVLFWYVFTDDPKKGFARMDWTTWDGAARTGYIGEHTGIVVGAELDSGGNIAKVGYYEGLSETIIWEDWKTLKTKAAYFDSAIVAKEK